MTYLSKDTIMLVESTVEQLKTTEQRLSTVDAKAAQKGKSRWLRSLKTAANKHATKTLTTMPRLTGRVQRGWTSAAQAHLKGQYDGWAGQLNTMLNKLKGKP
jgi:hypothetical protein